MDFTSYNTKIIKAHAQNENSTPNLCVIYNMLSKYTRKFLVNVCNEKELDQQRPQGNSKGNCGIHISMFLKTIDS
jgi:hypothetical protein